MPLCFVSNRVITPLLAFFCAVFCAFFLSNGASAQSLSDAELCEAWYLAPATSYCKGEGGTLAVGEYVKNSNGLWQCRAGAKDQWGHTVTWVNDTAPLKTLCGGTVTQAQ